MHPRKVYNTVKRYTAVFNKLTVYNASAFIYTAAFFSDTGIPRIPSHVRRLAILRSFCGQ